jgi:hypothetical protein
MSWLRRRIRNVERTRSGIAVRVSAMRAACGGGVPGGASSDMASVARRDCGADAGAVRRAGLLLRFAVRAALCVVALRIAAIRVAAPSIAALRMAALRSVTLRITTQRVAASRIAAIRMAAPPSAVLPMVALRIVTLRITAQRVAAPLIAALCIAAPRTAALHITALRIAAPRITALRITALRVTAQACTLFCVLQPPAHAAPHYAFAVIAGTLQSPADESPTQRLIDAIGRDPRVSFIVYDGNLKSGSEACRDSLYEAREALLQAARPALVFIPGQHDWADCGSAAGGGYDPVERLDQLRQTLFAEPSSMGQNPLPLTRESEVSRFRTYRENVRWQLGDTVFVGLNVPSPNNHYLTAGGRNGEFEDRVVATTFWLDHAAEYARRREAKAMVVFVQGDFDPERYERPERFAWLRFGHKPRDGYLEFKRSLVKLAETFRGPVLVIHQDDERAHGGFTIDQPLRNDKGALVTNLTRIAIAPPDRVNQWVQIDADMTRRPPFRVTVRDVPKDLPLLPTPPVPARGDPAAPMPEPMPAVPSLSPASELPPLLPESPPGVAPNPLNPLNQPAPNSSTGNGAASIPGQ